MQFTQILFTLVLATNAYAACTIDGTDPMCCWGGSDGTDACYRQNGGASCGNGMQVNNMCKTMGITSAQCDADCCDIRTGWGKPCPKGRNRCDADSGCPY